MQIDVDVTAIAHDARNAITVSHGRLQLMRRLAMRGDIDRVRLIGSLDSAIDCLNRVSALLSQMEVAAGEPTEQISDGPRS